MEIKVPDWLTERAHEFSGSRMELGDDASRLTWKASLDAAEEEGVEEDNLLSEIRDHAEGYGAWDREEIDSWTDAEVLAFLIQDMAAATRELESADVWNDDGTIDGEKWQSISAAGHISGRLYPGDDGEMYFSLGE